MRRHVLFTRRNGIKVKFEVVVNKEQLAVLQAKSEALGIALGTPQTQGPQITEGEVWEEVAGQFLLRSCPPGHQLINTTDGSVGSPLDVDAQRCSKCPPTTYIIDQLYPCVKCPKGAECPDGVQFTSKAPGSEWEEEQAETGGKRRRIASCPAGYAMQREPALPDADDCARCIENFYRLKPVRWPGPDVELPPCYACPKDATCPGGNAVEAIAGYWRLQTQFSGGYEVLDAASDVCQTPEANNETECLFPAGLHLLKAWQDSPMYCTSLPEVSSGLVCARKADPQLMYEWGVDTTNAQRRAASKSLQSSSSSDGGSSATLSNLTEDLGSARVYRCPLGACNANNSCAQQRIGPLCGRCSPGFAMTTQGCSAQICPPEEDIAPWRNFSIAIIALLVGVVWFIFSWRPVVPEADWLIARILQAAAGMFSHFVCFRDTHGDGADVAGSCSALIGMVMGAWTWIISKAKRATTTWQQNNGGQYVKIYITFFQILGSFDMFDITWPPLFTDIIEWIKGTFKFDVLRLPGASCMWSGVTFDASLRTYTVSPLVAIVMLGLPVVVGKHLRGLHRWSKTRMRETIDRFWTNLMFLLFLLYPALSIATMLVFNCDPNVGRLREDYRVVCPHAMTSLSKYSIVFLLMYPFGIPVLMHIALRVAGIPEVVREKVQQAEWAAMLSLFVKLYVSIEMQRFSRLVGNVDGEDFEFLCRQQFDILLALQDAVEDTATLEISVIRAKDLKAADRGGTSDPYVQVHVGNAVEKAKKTRVQTKTLSPEWNQTFKIVVEGGQKYDSVTIECMDNNVFGADESLGKFEIQLDSLTHGREYDEWRKIAAEGDETNHGQIQVRYRLVLGPRARVDGDTLLLSRLKCASAGGKGMEGTVIDSIVALLEQYDANGDGETDFNEFCTLITDVKAKASLFTGSEDVNALSEEQMDTLLLYHGWPTKHEGPSDLGEAEGMGGIKQLIDQNNKDTGQDDDDVKAEQAQRRANLAEGGDRSDPELERIDEMEQELKKREDEGHMSEWCMGAEHGWRNDIAQAKELYVQDPRKVDAFLETIHVKELPTDEKRSKVLGLAHDLVVHGIIAVPPQVWQQSTSEEHKKAVDRKDEEGDPTDAEEEEDVEPPKDQLLVSRFGFLFIAYRIQFWWWEGVEMFRKLLMTSLLVFVMPGQPGQLAAAAMITFCFLLLNLMCQPFCTATLNSLSTFTLMAQFATLFVGIMIALLDATPNTKATADRAIIEIMVVLINGGTMVWPLLRKVMTGQMQDYYDKGVGAWIYVHSNVVLRFCGSQEQKSKIAAQREKEKARRKRKKESSNQANMTTESEIVFMRSPSSVDRAFPGVGRISGEIQEAGLQLPDPLPATLQMSSARISEDAGVRPAGLPDDVPWPALGKTSSKAPAASASSGNSQFKPVKPKPAKKANLHGTT